MPEWTSHDGRYRVTFDHPDDPAHIWDLTDEDEPLVVVCDNADQAEAWVLDHTTPEDTSP